MRNGGMHKWMSLGKRLVERGGVMACALLVALVAVALAGCAGDDTEHPKGAASDVSASGAGGGSTSASGSGGNSQGPGDVLDPAQVYLVGYLKENTLNSRALVQWAAPEGAALGFDSDCGFDDAVIRPSDGRLLMLCRTDPANPFYFGVTEFHCDECPWSQPPGSPAYPQNTLDNDTVLPGPCGMDGAAYFDLAPDGSIYYHCNAAPDEVWLDDQGATVYEGDFQDPLIHVGHGGKALTGKRIVDLGTPAAVDLTGLPDGVIVAVRAVAPEGFMVAVRIGAVTAPDPQVDLWQIEASGAAMFAGTYPAAPEGYAANGSARLEPSGVLLQIGLSASGGVRNLIRREVGGASKVVYDDADDPLVKVTGEGHLVTGP